MRAVAFLLLALLAVLTVLLHRAAVAAAKPGDRHLSAIARELAGRQVSIRCEGLSGALIGPRGEAGRTGVVGDKPVSVSYLQAEICQTLHAYARARAALFNRWRIPVSVATRKRFFGEAFAKSIIPSVERLWVRSLPKAMHWLAQPHSG